MELLKVLVVDDEPGIRSGIRRILERFTVDYPFMDEEIGFEIYEAGSGEEALDLVDRLIPEIILLDNKLPGIHGVDLLEYINKNYPEILVTMITSYASLELAVKATTFGAYDFVPKPFTPQELKSSLENVVKHHFLRRMTKKLNKEGKQVRFQFLSILSHELKAPLNAIDGYLQMMKEKQAGDKLEDYEQVIERSISRVSGMRNLIMDLLDLTRIESGKKKREVTDVDLCKIAKSAVDTMRPYAIQKDVTIDLDCQDSLYMKADAEEMEIIFNNLISNAVKYNKESGKVTCSILPGDSMITIKVEDSGIGIEQNQIPTLFNEFVRIKNEQTKYISGSGLGLSIVKKITNLYKGTINVTSIPNEGSIFTVELCSK